MGVALTLTLTLTLNLTLTLTLTLTLRYERYRRSFEQRATGGVQSPGSP